MAGQRVIPLHKTTGSHRELNVFCKPRDVAFSKGAYGSCNLKVICDRRGSTRRQKDISRLLREKKSNPPQRPKKDNKFPIKKRGR